MKLSNSKRAFAVAVAAIMMSTYQLTPMPVWACTASSAGGFAYSSNTGPTSVTVCAKSVTITRTAATPVKTPAVKAPIPKAPVTKAPVAKPSPKPTPAKVIALLTPIKKGVPAALKKPVPKIVAKPVAKSAPKPVASPTKPKASEIAAVNKGASSAASAAGEVSFSPSPISVSASATNAAVGQAVEFWANSSTHYRSGVLLGKATDVRFTPIETVWNSDQGQSSVGATVSWSFGSPGAVEVAARVTYSVSYQIAGASGWVSSGEIAVSDSVGLVVLEGSEPPREGTLIFDDQPSKIVRLVGNNCISRSAVFGCNP